MEEELKKAGTLIVQANNVVAFTGAGISVESGIPDFRSAGGLWSKFDPSIYCDFSYFQSSPDLFWEMSREMQATVAKAKPNPAHITLADMEKQGLLSCIITQNVDNLHQQAGSTKVFELHGNAATSTCMMCKETIPTLDAMVQFQEDEKVKVPKCRICDGVLKMDVVLFGEALQTSILESAIAAAMTADVLLVIGTSLAVSPANMIVNLCRKRNGRVIIVDPDKNVASHASVMLCGNAGDMLPRLSETCLALRNRWTLKKKEPVAPFHHIADIKNDLAVLELPPEGAPIPTKPKENEPHYLYP